MNSLPYKLDTTNDQLTSSAGLLTVALLMEQLELSKHLNEAFPEPKSNRGIAASSYLETLILMQHQSLFHLDDVNHLHEDQALSQVLGINRIPSPSVTYYFLNIFKISLLHWENVTSHYLQAAF